MTLPEQLNTDAAPRFLEELKNAQGNPVILDAAPVQFVGGLCFEILLAAQQHWKEVGIEFSLGTASSEFMECVERLGMPADTFSGGYRMALKVLAVDDSLTIRDLLRSCLANAGYEVDVAVDGMDGLEKMPDAQPDVVITNINIPRMNGFDFIDALQTGDRPTSVPILVLTTESTDELKQRAREAGATGWIVKPFDETRLVTAIRRATNFAV